MTDHIVIINYRDSDSDTETSVFGADEVTVIDVDNGRSDLSDRESFISWGAHHLHEAKKLRGDAQTRAADYLESLVYDEFNSRWGDPQDGLGWAEVVDYISEWERLEEDQAARRAQS